MSLRLSVVVSTYNNPRALALVFAGLARQTVRGFEVLIADDGSGPDTRAVIEEWTARAPFRVQHLWHPDEGFRKCAILNRAILAAGGDYLVFFDGDCVPPAHCLQAHCDAAHCRRYVTGGAVMLSPAFSRRLTPEAVLRGDLERFGWWWLQVKRPRRLFASRIPVLRGLLDRNVRRPPGWRGGNASAFAHAVRLVRGFDERFTYGYEDADFGHRLEAAGVVGVSVRYTAPVFHVDHPRPPTRGAEAAANKALYDANRVAQLTATPYGLPEAGAAHPAALTPR